MSNLYFCGDNKPVTEDQLIELLKQYDPREASEQLNDEIESCYGRKYHVEQSASHDSMNREA